MPHSISFMIFLGMEEKRKNAIKALVEKLGSKADTRDMENVESKLEGMNRGPVAAIWDKVTFLWNTFRNDCPPAWKALIIGALLYLVLPVDIVPDFIPGAGLVDDVFAIGYVFASVKALAQKAAPAIEKKADRLIKANVYPLVKAELDRMHMKRLVNSLVNLLVFIVAELLVIFPVFGTFASSLVSSLLLTGAAVWAAVRTVKAVIRSLPVVREMWKVKSVKGGLAEFFRSHYKALSVAEKFVDSFFALIGEKENRKTLDRLVDYAYRLLIRDLVRFVLVEAVIIAIFFIVRRAMMGAGDVSTFSIIFQPYISLAASLENGHIGL